MPDTLELRDATGNVRTAWPTEHGDGSFAFPGFCLKEDAWKLRVTFLPRYPPGAPADFTWTTRVRVPGQAQMTPIAQTIRRQGVLVRVKHAWGRTSSNGGCIAGGPPFVALETSGAQSLRVTLIRVRDRKGRDLTRYLPGYGRPRDPDIPSAVCGADSRSASFTLGVPPGVRTLYLTFAVHRGRTVEFLAKPPLSL
jgi:hypothetical protein